jgi:RNA polymerase sigma-70 factor, ECF subfamily
MGEEVRSVVARAKTGDRKAFGELVRSTQRRVFMTALRMMGNDDDARDVTQDAFVRAYRGLASFDGRSEFFTWLYRIVVNVALNHRRQTRRRRSVPLEEVELSEPMLQSAGSDPRRALELKRSVLETRAALDELSPALRATVVLVIMEGMPYREAAAILECSEGTVAWRVHEARQKLRQRLGEQLPAVAASGAGETKDENGLSGDTGEALRVRR